MKFLFSTEIQWCASNGSRVNGWYVIRHPRSQIVACPTVRRVRYAYIPASGFMPAMIWRSFSTSRRKLPVQSSRFPRQKPHPMQSTSKLNHLTPPPEPASPHHFLQPTRQPVFPEYNDIQFTHMIRLLVLLVGFVTFFSHPTSSWAGASYEESLKQLAEDVTEGAIKAKKQRLAFLDFTD